MTKCCNCEQEATRWVEDAAEAGGYFFDLPFCEHCYETIAIRIFNNGLGTQGVADWWKEKENDQA